MIRVTQRVHRLYGMMSVLTFILMLPNIANAGLFDGMFDEFKEPVAPFYNSFEDLQKAQGKHIHFLHIVSADSIALDGSSTELVRSLRKAADKYQADAVVLKKGSVHPHYVRGPIVSGKSWAGEGIAVKLVEPTEDAIGQDLKHVSEVNPYQLLSAIHWIVEKHYVQFKPMLEKIFKYHPDKQVKAAAGTALMAL